MEPRQGQEVIVYDRCLFAVPVRGVINNISNDGALKVTFYPNNPGGSNLTQHNGKYFLREQCRGINGELFYKFEKATSEENKMEPYLVKLEKEIDGIRGHMPDNAGLLAIAYAMIGISQALENASRRWKEVEDRLWKGE